MISIIVPVYNVEPYLRQCLDSVIGQTYRDLEILLIDDGSPDRCGVICDHYAELDSRIRVFHTGNNGLSAARNLGLREATGSYIGFVDSDDWIELNMYEALVEMIERNDAELCVCGFWKESIKTTEWKLETAAYSGTEALRALLDGTINDAVWNKLFKKSIFEKTSFPEGKNYEDSAIMHRVFAEASKVVVVPTPLYHYRKRPQSITASRSAKDILDGADACLSRFSFIHDEKQDLFFEKIEQVKLFVATGICMVWRWWFGYTSEEKQRYSPEIKELMHFTRENIPLFGYRSWPAYIRFCTLFMYSDSATSFAVLYWMNRAYRRMRGLYRKVMPAK